MSVDESQRKLYGVLTFSPKVWIITDHPSAHAEAASVNSITPPRGDKRHCCCAVNLSSCTLVLADDKMFPPADHVTL